MSSQSDPVLEPLVRKLSYWTEFDADDQKAILDLPWRTKRLGRRQYIAREQEAVTQSCVLLEGFAIQLKMVAGGGRGRSPQFI